MNENFSPWDFALAEVQFNPHAVSFLHKMRSDGVSPPFVCTVEECGEIYLEFVDCTVTINGTRVRVELDAEGVEDAD